MAEKIYINKADQKYLVHTVFYQSENAQNYVYVDEDCTIPATKDELKAAFLAGSVVVCNIKTNGKKEYCIPTMYDFDSHDYASVLVKGSWSTIYTSPYISEK